MIPLKIERLVYTKHAQREQFQEPKGIIQFTPRSFYRSGCKSCNEERNRLFRAVYVYDDKRDINLIIDPVTCEVITNYITFSNNINVFKGRFRITQTKK